MKKIINICCFIAAFILIISAFSGCTDFIIGQRPEIIYNQNSYFAYRHDTEANTVKPDNCRQFTEEELEKEVEFNGVEKGYGTFISEDEEFIYVLKPFEESDNVMYYFPYKKVSDDYPSESGVSK